jgi:hypothetical protein
MVVSTKIMGFFVKLYEYVDSQNFPAEWGRGDLGGLF